MNLKPKILICDDDSEILQTLNLSLRSNFEVTTANSVEKAMKLVFTAKSINSTQTSSNIIFLRFNMIPTRLRPNKIAANIR